MKIIPLGGRVLLIQTAAEQVTTSGIIIPDASKHKPLEGIVAAVGPDVENLKEGDKVVFKKYAENEVRFNDVDYIVMDAADVLLKIV